MSEHTCPSVLDEPPEFGHALDRAGKWVACEHPERPVDDNMLTASDCAGCQLAATVARNHAFETNLGSTEETMDRLS